MKNRLLRIVLTSLALCGVMAFLRWMETYHVIQGKDVTFQQLHDLTWDNYERSLTRSGNDPYAWFKLPPQMSPIARVSIDFDGAYVPGEGTDYFFPALAGPSGDVLGAQTTAKAEVHGTYFTVSCDLPGAKALRIDLPDFLARSVALERMEIHTAFWGWTSWRLRSTVLFGAVALGGAIILLLPRAR